VQNLKALATAQAQYNKKTDYYSWNAALLNTTGTLIAADLSNAFDSCQNNLDGANGVSPKAGFEYIMLQGDGGADGTQLTNFYKDSSNGALGMNTWGATARSAVPFTTGEHQYFISEQGTVYKRDEPAAGSTGGTMVSLPTTGLPMAAVLPVDSTGAYNHFCLNACISNAALATVTSWTTAK
ncbi:MAG: hypothetical protein ACREP2_13120, partial [Rhodanobacteraceae bacterium]